MITRCLAGLGLVVALALPTAAHAGDKPLYRPAPEWVKPVAMPPVPAKLGAAAVQILLLDEQVAFEPDRQTIYSEFAMLIQTSEGLAAGNISLPWNPANSDLIVHRIAIRRGDKVIDVLAAGQMFSVVRREANLENAALDGMLTANIQPEGLQVGDVLLLSASISTSDPVMGGHAESIAATWNAVPIARAHLRLQWPKAMPVRLRQTGALPPLKPVESGGTTAVELSLDGIEPIPGPKGAPLRYQLGRRVEATDFRSWAEVAALMAPLYRKAAVLPTDGPLAEEVKRIAAASRDPKVRAKAALALVQDRIRYVALMMGTGGLVPADVATTWARRYGDCKAKTVMLIAVLKALGIDAEPVLVSTQAGDGLDERLPMIGAFDHVLVRSEIGGRTYWLDGTRQGDTVIDRIQVPDLKWGLPIRADGAALVRMTPAPFDKPMRDVTIKIDARGGLTTPAPTTIAIVFRGDFAIGMKTVLANMTAEARDRSLREFWKREYDFIDPTKVDASYDPLTGEQRLTLDGTARMDWSSGWYETDGTSVGYRADFARDPGPDRDAPFAVPFPTYSRTEETILLPKGFPDEASPGKDDVDRTVAGIAYRRTVTLKNAVFHVEKTERSVAAEFPAKDAPAAQVVLRDLAKQTLYIRRPASYAPTDAELSLSMNEQPTTVAALLDRGFALVNRGRHLEAIGDYDAALAIDPRNADVLANRGLAKTWLDRTDEAEKDLDAAAAINPLNVVLLRGRGLLAQRRNDHAAAVKAFTESLTIEPDSNFALTRRGMSYRALGETDKALADATAAIARGPDMIDAYQLRANIYRERGESDAVLKDIAAMTAANPDNAYAHVLAANFYSSMQRKDEAMRAFDRALAIKPDAMVYLNRSMARPKTESVAKLDDLDAALKLDPSSTAALVEKGRVLEGAGDVAGAIALFDTAMKSEPGRADLLLLRGIARLKAGNGAGADSDFGAARAAAKNPADLNNLCWAKATGDVALASALVDCDMALAKAPDSAAFLDSKALVLLRLGRLDDAIAAYDRVLAIDPKIAGSWFGRAVAWSRKGNTKKAAADLAAARRLDAEVEKPFAAWGVTIAPL